MNRPTADSAVALRPVDASNWRAIIDLQVAGAQSRFVAPNVRSLAEAYVHPVAWTRAIYAEETAVGFLMLHDETRRATPRRPLVYYLWRLMIDGRFQGRGYGRRAIQMLVEHVRGLPEAHHLLTSCVEGEGGPIRFYERMGFVRTGRDHDGEIELCLALGDGDHPLPPIPWAPDAPADVPGEGS